LRHARDNVLRALNSARNSLEHSFPAFSFDSDNLFDSVGTFTSAVFSRSPDQHLRAVEERDEYFVANKEYAEELRALRSEHLASVLRVLSLTAENLQLRIELASLRSPPRV
jgi:hypothetical protein